MAQDKEIKDEVILTPDPKDENLIPPPQDPEDPEDGPPINVFATKGTPSFASN